MRPGRKKILLVFGTRPEAIKMAPVIKKIRASSGLESVVCVTGQHREMLDSVLGLFGITPDYDLNIMSDGQDLFDITTRAVEGLKGVLGRVTPEVVLVQGDTTTAFVAALSAYYMKIPVGHVEAGLRTYDKYSPFPEEKNRHLLSVLADYHFAPTERAKSNLLKEGVAEENIWVTGNTVIDALHYIVKRNSTPDSTANLKRYFDNEWDLPLMSDGKKLILVTGHRRENFGEGFRNICMALKDIAEKREDVEIVYPVHLNPDVQGPVKAILNRQPNVHLKEPMAYEQFIYLMDKAYLVLTDSGGIQEEAPSLGKPVLVMRDKTERPEGVEAGTVKLVGTGRDRIVAETLELLDNRALYAGMSKTINPYGDGRAAGRICKVLE
ncbi:MAG: UDP-N-acetylglucosamine 2-epimerase (non-hydrolyzing) [Thermodesulfobacteriota bacterium]